MKLRNLAFGALALVLIALGGAWTLGHLMPLLTVRAAARSSPLTAAAMQPTTLELQRELALHPLAGAGDGRGLAALIWAARTGRTGSIAVLARAGVDLDAQDDGPNGWRPLHHAVHKNQLGSVRTLLALGAAADGTNPDGTTPLMLAAAQGEGVIVEALLAAGADARLRRPAGDSALTFAVQGGDERAIRAVLARAPELRREDGFRAWAGRLALRLRGRGDLARLVEPAEP